MGVTKGSFLAVDWIFASVIILLTIGRVLIRKLIIKKFYWDDFFHLLAATLLVISAILNSFEASTAFILVGVGNGSIPKPPHAEYQAMQLKYLRYNFALTIVFWSILFSVKASFLFLYRAIFQGVGRSFFTWNAVAFFVFASYWILLSTLFTSCGSSLSEQINTDTCFTKAAESLQHTHLIISVVLNCTTDLAIMALPLPAIWKLQMDTSQKLGVASVFLLAWLTIAFDVIRVVETFQLGSALVALYTTLEVDVAVIISALPAFKVLLKRSTYQPGHAKSLSNKGMGRPSQGAHRLEPYVGRDSELSVNRNFDLDFNRQSHYDDPRMDLLHQNPMKGSSQADSPV